MKKTLTVALCALLALTLCLTAFAAENEDGFSGGELPAGGEEDVLIFPTESAAIPPETELPAVQTDAPRETPTRPAARSAPSAEPQAEERSAEPSQQTNVPVMIAVVVLVLAVGMVPVMLLRKNRNAAKVTEYKEAGNEK